MNSQDLIYAIDFGTTNSLMVMASKEKVYPLAPLDLNAKDKTIMRSLLFTPGYDEWFIGASAITKYQELGAEGRLLRSLKRFLPRESFKGTVISDRHYSLEELIALFLRKMRETANQFYNVDVTKVVMGRPALYSTNEAEEKTAVKRMEKALKMAGFTEIHFCPEPVAAAYSARNEFFQKEVNLFIADFGGGTSDFTVAKLGGSVEKFNRPRVLSLGGLSMAGDAYDGSIMKNSVSPFFGSKLKYKSNLGSNILTIPKRLLLKLTAPSEISFLGRNDIQELLKTAGRFALDPDEKKKLDRLFVLIEEHLGFSLYHEIEKSKIRLSKDKMAPFQFNYPEIEIDEMISQEEFIEGSLDLSQKIIEIMDETIQKSHLKYEDLDLVYMTGGTANIKFLRQEIEKRVGSNKLKDQEHFHSIIKGLGEFAKDLLQ